MITVTLRPYTEEEKLMLRKALPSLNQRVGQFVFRLIGIVLVFLILLLVIDRFHPIPSGVQAWLYIVFVAIGLARAIWRTRKADGFTNKKQRISIDEGIAKVFNVQTHRAVRMEDTEDYGPAYFLDVNDQGTRKTLFVWGQYLDLLEGTFPNTVFELVKREDTGEFIDIRLSGVYFEAERSLPPFYIKDRTKGNHPRDGDLLDVYLEDIGPSSF